MRQKKKTVREYLPVENIKQFAQTLPDRGDKVLFRYYTDSACRHIEDISYATFALQVRNLSAAFREMGLEGKRIAVIGETSPTWVTAYLATVAGGSVVIPMDKELSFEEILGFLEISEAKAIVYSHTFSEQFEGVVGHHKTVEFFVPMDKEGCTYLDKEGVVAFSDLLQKGEQIVDYTFPQTEDMNRMAEMLFTSGTTGTSKCVMLSEKNIVATINSACETVEFFPDDTIVSVLPIHHTYELRCMLAGMNYGMTIGINSSLKYVLKSFAAFRPTGLVLVPLFVETMYKKIWDEAKKKGKDKMLRFALKLSAFLRVFGIDIRHILFKDILAAFGGRLNRIVSGAAPLSPEIVKKFDGFGITIMEGYGITECSPLVSVNPYYALKSGSVGPAVPCCQVKIYEPQGEKNGFPEGEIVVKGDNVTLGYYKNDEENRRAFTEDGWYRTGDIGYMDDDGYIYITGRKKSVIVLENGKNVFPEEVEEYLRQIPGILECVAVGRTSPENGHVTVIAIIVPDTTYFAGKSMEEIENTLRAAILDMNKKLPSFKQVKALELRDEPFEKTTTRKIKRHLVH
ncbi:MAG: AMP-binding protein [Clostridia bacterium]|nr:AMP-binding protein [Clostridia bacterium]